MTDHDPRSPEPRPADNPPGGERKIREPGRDPRRDPGRDPGIDPVRDPAPLRAPPVDPVTSRASGGGFYLVAGVLIAIVLAAGALIYNPGIAPGERNEQARSADRTIDAPAIPPRPAPPVRQ